MHRALSERYARFAREEAAGRSPLYQRLTQGVAADDAILSLLATLPEPRQQPNLLLGAMKFAFGAQPDWPRFRDLVVSEWPEISAIMRDRTTQTNEVGRCATLLPVLAGLPQPLALIEVGASAGLCLLPDRYAYDYGGGRLAGAATDARAPTLRCDPGGAPVPDRLPDVVWRAGLDLNPIDVNDADACAWLEALIWPEQTGRLARLRAALAIARDNPPTLVRGDLMSDLPALVRQAPREATLVIFHTAVLGYVVEAGRAIFTDAVQRLGAVWIANEAPAVLPQIAAQLRGRAEPGRFILAVNGKPRALTDPHGVSMVWIGE